MKTTNRPAASRLPNDPFAELMRLWQSQPYSAQPAPAAVSPLAPEDAVFAPMLHLGPCLTWVLDVRTGRYCFVSNNVSRLLGYPASAFTEGGISFLQAIIHPADAPHAWRHTKSVWESILALQPGKRKGYQFNRHYRVRKADRSYVRLLEQSTVLHTDSQGNITHVLGVCTDISGCMGSPVTAALSPEDAPLRMGPAAADPFSLPGQLSKREQEIVRLIAAGLSSKQIAEKLFISLNTVNTHRKKMIEKTHSKNTGGLVQFAFLHNLI
ncbi:MAG TPA: LuxR C-terminal-related transcriptional regulator [Cytophagales bacterium]